MSISISEVSYTYPTGKQVLDDVSLVPLQGSLTLVCGASGSGKSTMVRLLNGLIPHFHHGERTGEVLVDGAEVAHTPIERMGLSTATVFQNPTTQFFTTTVDEELAFAGQNYRVPADEIRRRRAAALAELGIEDLAGRNLRGLSGGQLQKVACAQALAQQTGIVLLDEPTSNLDPESIEEVYEAIMRLKADGKTLLVAEHRVYFLRGLVDEAVIMRNGRIAERMDGESFYAMSDDERRGLGLRTLETPVLRVPATPVAANREMGGAVGDGGTEASGAGAGGTEGADGAAPPSSSDERDGLRVENLVVDRGGNRILDIASLHFPAGRITGVVGPNGIGKTTLVRAVCRLQRTRKGTRVTLDGRPLKDGQAFLVMQDVHRQLFTEAVSEEASLPQLQRLDLDALADRHPLSLSGGQKQRLVIATAIDQDARVVILDEPTSGVDHRHLVSIAQELRSLADEGRVVVVISHDAEFLNECADGLVELTGPVPTRAPRQ